MSYVVVIYFQPKFIW